MNVAELARENAAISGMPICRTSLATGELDAWADSGTKCAPVALADPALFALIDLARTHGTVAIAEPEARNWIAVRRDSSAVADGDASNPRVAM